MNVARNSVSVTLINAASQAGNFVLYASIAAFFGANWHTDAFFLALTIPALFLVAVGTTITAVYIPILTECRVRHPGMLGQLVGSALVYVVSCAIIVASIVALTSPIIMTTIGRGLTVEGQALAVQHMLMLLPMIVLQAAIAVLAAVYNASGQFTYPAAATTCRYVITLCLVTFLRPVIGITSLPVAFLLGSLFHLALLVVLWRKLRVQVVFTWGLEPRIIRSFRLAGPLIVGAVLLHLNVVISRFLAAQLPAGSVSILDYASRISTGVMELLTSGIFLVTLTDWSQTVTDGDAAHLRAKLRQTILMTLFVIMPVVAIIWALREPIIAAGFERGQFDASVTATTASVLAFLLTGIPVDVIGRAYVRLFQVWENTGILCRLGALRLVTTSILAVALIPLMHVQALALADVLGGLVVVVSLVFLANRRLGNTLSGLWLRLTKLGLSAVVSGLVTALLHASLSSSPVWLRLPVAASFGGITYLLIASLLRVEEFSSLFRLIISRRGKEQVV